MKVFVIMRGDASVGFCPVIETARVTDTEAKAYIAEHERTALQTGDDETYWVAVQTDMPLALAREMATANG